MKTRIFVLMMFVLICTCFFAVAHASVSDGRMVANIDKIETYGTTLHVVGWAYDTQNPGATVTIDVDSLAAYQANRAKGSSNSSCPVGGNHYFDFTYPWKNTGTRVMIHAMYTVGAGACKIYDNISSFTSVYTVTYNANGGSGAPAKDYKHHDISLRLSSTVPTRTGHTFAGWATSASGNAAYQANGSYNSNSHTTLYAVWKKNNYTVSFNANGGSSAPGAQTAAYNTALTLSNTVPTRQGYDFLGWSTSQNGSAAYQPGGSITVTGNVSLYAVWKIKSYTVSFDANGGSGAPGAQSANYNTALTLSNTVPTRTGYDFLGWATSSNGNAAYQPGGSITVTGNVNLYAVWQIKTYTISYDANGGSGAPAAQSKTHGTALTLSSTAPVREGHHFRGWTADGTDIYQPGGSYMEEGDAVLTAVWDIITYTVSYDANGGTGAPEAQTKIHGTDLVLSMTIPVREDYTFTGWATGSDPILLTVVVQPGFVYTANADLTLYAQWEENRLPGDVNGDGAVDGKDALRLLKYMAENPVTIVERNADVNNDGIVNGKDTLRLLKYFAEWDVELE